MIHQLKIAVVRRPEDWICYVPPDDLGCSLHNPLFDSDGHEAEDILTICFVLRVGICVDFWFEGAVFGAGLFGGCSRLCENVLFPDVDCQLLVIERVSNGARQSLYSVGGVFEQLSLEDALDLGDELVHVVVGVAAGLVFV